MVTTCAACRPIPQGTASSAAPEGTTTPSSVDRARAKELGGILPHWCKAAEDPPGPTDYANLKPAALAMARASERERRNVIAAYEQAFCSRTSPDGSKSSGMFLLLRVLFIVPTRVSGSDIRFYGGWAHPPRAPGATWTDLSWPVHIDPYTHVLHVEPPVLQWERCSGAYWALQEYDYFAQNFPRRSPEEIEALAIR